MDIILRFYLKNKLFALTIRSFDSKSLAFNDNQTLVNVFSLVTSLILLLTTLLLMVSIAIGVEILNNLVIIALK